MQSRPTQRRRALAPYLDWKWPAWTCIAGWILNVVGFYPGMMSDDSFAQYFEASRGTYTDQYPLIMTLVWRFFLFLHRGPQLVLVFQTFVLWGTLFILALDCAERWRSRAGFFLPLLALLPMVLVDSGVIWKDVWMVNGLLLACVSASRAEWAFAHGRREPARRWAWLSGVSLVIGASMRANALPAVVGLLPFLGQVIGPILLPKLARKAWVAAALLLVFAIGFPRTLNSVAGVRATPQVQYFQLYDLAGISVHEGKPIFPEWSKHRPRFKWELVQALYRPGWASPLFYDYFGVSFPLETSQTREESAELGRFHRSAILKYPVSWFAHRWKNFSLFLGTDASIYPSPVFFGFEAVRAGSNQRLELDFAFEFNPVSRAVYAWLKFFDRSPFYLPWVWIYFGFAGLLGLFAIRRKIGRRPGRSGLPPALLLSGLVYAGHYLLVAASVEYRYLYWAVVAIAVAICLVAHEYAAFREKKLG